MNSTLKAVCMPVVVLLAILFTTGLVQADDNKRKPKEQHKTAELKITKSGPGEATIISFPEGIDCGGTCRAEFNIKSAVTLTATATPGSSFKRWGGACKGTTPTCTVTLKQAQNVTAISERLPITLTVTKTGAGTGTVTSAPAGIDCGPACSATYSPKQAAHDDDSRKTREHQDSDEDHQHDDDHERGHDHDHGKPAALVTLTATPAPGSIFQGWTGACTGSASTCTVTMNQTQSVTAAFAPMPMTLSVSKTGSGTGGTITSLQTGIDCGTVCSAIYDWSSPVTLAATPAIGAVFKGWSGACIGTAANCTVTMDQHQAVSAEFATMPMTLTAAKTGSGTGTITSQPAGIDCGPTCSGSYDWGTQITLTATPAGDATFQGWTGACTGTATTCVVTMDQTHNVTADFAPAFKTLSLSKTGSGTGTVTSQPAGIDCGANCRADFATDTVITLTATPVSGSTFQGWFGACTGNATTCTVTLNQAKTANATFSAPAVTTYQYDANGNLTQITDPLGRIRKYQYDALNQPVRQLEPHPSLIGSTLGQIDTAYDSLGQIKSITDPRNLTTTYTTDSLGNLSQQTSPDTGVTTADHDEAGNLLTRTDARNKTATYSYDSLNRVSQIAYDDQTVTYTWDSCTNGIGRLCSLSNNNSNLTYSYDSHGRISQKSQNAGAAPLTVSHTYNSAGQRTATLSPGGQTIDYQWIAGRITAISVNGQPVIGQIGYDPGGQINGWTWGNNQQHERFHDLAGRPVIVSLGFDAQGQLPNSRYYGYDAAGRQTSAINDLDPKQNQQYRYDELDRLTGSQRGDTQTSRTDYAYDLSGNRSEAITDTTILHSYSTDHNSNRLQSQSGAQTASYSYDPTGNLTGVGIVSHSYNAAGRRIASTNTATGQTTTYGYNALGQRISKTSGANTRQFFYDEHGHLTGEYDATGKLIQEIVWLGDLPVAVLKPATPANPIAAADLYYLHADHLGTPRTITRPNDNRVVWSWESEAFGNSLPEQNPSGLGNFVFNLRFPGQYYDQETGLFYNYFRDYDPQTGRYIESDPIGLAGGINSYVYVGNNPLRWTDWLGLKPGVDTFDTYQDAAIDALDWVYSQYPNSPHEWAGTVYQLDNGKYIATVPNEGIADSSNPSQPPNLIKPDAFYHTHGQCLPDKVDDEFSDGFFQDKWKADFRQISSYIETPGHMIKRYDPDPNRQGKGNVTTLRGGCSCPGPIR